MSETMKRFIKKALKPCISLTLYLRKAVLTFLQSLNTPSFSRHTARLLAILGLGITILFTAQSVSAQFNEEINYQGKLTDDSGVTVADGTYHMKFRLYNQEEGGSALWEGNRSLSAGDRVAITSGLFSVMLGSSTPLSSVDFNQTLYLEVEIGGTASSTWETLTPRKRLGAVPAAFVAADATTFSGIATTSFLRSDQADEMAATTASTLLTVTNNGAGNIAQFASSTGAALTIANDGAIGIGTTSPEATLAVSGAGGGSFVGGYKALSLLEVENNLSWNLVYGNKVAGAGAYMANFLDNAGDLRFGDATQFGILQLRASGGNYGVGINMSDSLSAAAELDIRPNTGADDSPVLRLTSNHSNPSLDDVIGTIEFYSDKITTGDVSTAKIQSLYNNSGGNGGYLTFDVGANAATRAMTLDYSGYLGLGTTTPTALLTVGSSTPSALTASNYYNSAYIAGLLEVGGSGTSTFAGTLDTNGAGTSTFANGITLENGCLTIGGTCISASGDTSYVVAANNTDTNLKAYADYIADGTNDEEEIQNAIDAAYNGGVGGTVYLLAGTFNVGTTTYTDRAINMATSTRLIGQGDATIIKLQDHDANINIIEAENVQDVYIGHLAVDGNQDAPQAAGNYYGIYFSNTGSSTIENTYVHDVQDNGLSLLFNSANNLITGNTISGNGNVGFYTISSTNNFITNNTISNNQFGLVLSGASNNTISGNTMNSNHQYGLYLFSGASNNTISGNTMNSNHQYGLYLSGFGNTITGNTLYNNSTDGVYASIYLNNADDNIISSNSIEATSTDPLIQIPSNSNRNVVVGNQYINTDTTTYVSDAGTDTRYTQWDRQTLTTDDERAYNLLSVVGSTSAALFSATQYSTGTIMSLFDNTTEVFTVADGGNVGLGTTSPWAKLSVQYTDGTDSGPRFIVGSSTAQNLIVDADGDIGIGDSAPLYPLDILGADAATGLFQLRMSSVTTGGTAGIVGRHWNGSEEDYAILLSQGGAGDNELYFGGAGASGINAATKIRFYTAPTNTTLNGLERLTIVEDGAVGIGDNTPTVLLTVGTSSPSALTGSEWNSAYISGLLEVGGSGTSTFAGTLDINGSATSTFANALQATCFTTDGVSCINTLPAVWTSSGGYTYMNTLTDNVGIGTTTPAAKLTIEGDAGQTSNLFAVATSTMAASSSSGYAEGLYARIDSLGKTTLTGKVLNPTLAGNWDPNDTNIMNSAYSVTVSGNYAYVAGNSSNNLAIVDISDPANPTTTGNWDPNDLNTIWGARSVTVSGNYAYVAGNSSNNLAIVDISDPANPTTTGNWDPNDLNIMNSARSVTVSGNYAYVAGFTSDNLAIVDISDPANPTTTGNWDPNNVTIMWSTNSVAVSGKYAYVAGLSSNNLAIVDISDPANPTTTGNWDPNDTNVMWAAKDVTISGNYAYVVGLLSDTLAIVDISDPANPTTTGIWEPNDDNVTNQPGSVTVSGNYAYVSGESSDNLAIVDISDPANPTTTGNWDPNDANIMDFARSVTVSGNYAYVAGGNSNNLAIVDIGALDVANVYAGNIRTDQLAVDQTAQFDQGINVRGGANIGTNALIGGALTITGTASSGMLTTGNTNPALVVTTGNVGIGTTSPVAKLSIVDGAILAAGTTGSTPLSGAGTRMMWIPEKGAFRAGVVTGVHWDDANIGTNSAAFGYNNYATGTESVAFGWTNRAGGNQSVAFGNGNNAYGQYSTVAGWGNTVNAIGSTAFGALNTAYGAYSAAVGLTNNVSGLGSFSAGSNNIASGDYATAFGNFSTASGTDSLAIGKWVEAYHHDSIVLGYGAGAGSSNLTSTQDKQFAVGFDTILPQFVINTDGSVGIGTTSPWAKLSLNYTDGTDSGPRLYVGSSTVANLFVGSDGNVGIGTTTPSATFSVYGDAILEGTDRYLNFGAATSSAGYGIRDNGGAIEIKDANGSWVSYATATKDKTVATYIVATNDSVGSTSADYVADGTQDEVQIQAAIDALPAGGGVVYLLEGTYTVSTSTATGVAINLATSTKLVGAGESTIIKLADNINSNAKIVQAVNVQEIYIGSLAIDGNQTNQSAATYYGMYFDGTSSSTIENTYVHDVQDYGIYKGSGSNNNKLIGNILKRNVNTGIYLWLNSNNTLSGNTVENNGSGIYFDESSYNTVANNKINNNNAYGAAFDQSSNNTFTANISSNNLWHGVTLTNLSSNNTVNSNILTGNKSRGVFIVSNSKYNIITGNSISFSGETGVTISTDANNNTLVGNTFYGNGHLGVYEGINIWNSDDNIISSNNIEATSSDMLIQIEHVGSERNTIVGNVYENPDITVYVSDAGTDTRYTQWDRVTLTTDDERAYSLLSVMGSTSAALFSATQYSTGTIMSLFDNATEVFTVADGGNVGVGTTSPFAALSVDGSFIYASTTATSTFTNALQATCFTTDGTSCITGNGAFATAGGYTTLVNATDFVGINTSTPWAKFTTVYTDGTDTGPRLFVGSSTLPSLFVSSTGLVGVGTNNPTDELQVKDIDGDGIAYLTMGSAAQPSGLQLFYDQPSDYNVYLQSTYSGATTEGNIRFVTGGHIKSSPILTLEAKSSAGVGIWDTTPDALFEITQYPSALNDYIMVSSSTDGDVFTIASNLNTGIGTSTPEAKLTVVGTEGQTSNLFALASSTITATSSAGSANGYYATIDQLGRTTLTGGVLTPMKVGGTTTVTETNMVTVQGDYAYVVLDSGAGDEIEIYDISDPTTPNKISGVSSTWVYEVVVAGNYLYAGLYDSGGAGDELKIYDISDPTDPTEVGGTSASSTIYGLAVQGKYAYAGSSSNGDDIEIFDISDPTNPVKVGGTTTSHIVYDVKVAGNYLYAGLNGNAGDELEVFDISDPTQPIKIGGAPVDSSANHLVVSGKYAYVASASPGDDIQIYDISDPTNPSEVGAVGVTGAARGMEVAGEYLYVAAGRAEIFDVSDPTTPVKVAEYDTTVDSVNDVAVVGNYLYVVSTEVGDGLEIFDITALKTANLYAGVIKAGQLAVNQTAYFDNSINVRGGANIGNDAMINGALTIQGTASSGMLTTGNTNPALVVTTGNVGVGTTSPWAKLSVNYTDGTDTGPRFFVGSSTVPDLIVTQEGKVGFGTTSPWADFTVQYNGGDTGPRLYVGGGVLPNLFVASDGKVAIGGTTTPSYALTIAAGTGDGIELGNHSIEVRDVFDTPLIQRTSAGNSVLSIAPNTTGLSAFELYGTDYQETSSSYERLQIVAQDGLAHIIRSQALGSGSYQDINIYASSSGQLYLDTNGGVGIGTTSPNATLSVYGDVLLEGTDRYINFSPTAATGTSGYGIRDNGGVIEVKNQSGGWAQLGADGTVATYVVAAYDSVGSTTADYAADGTNDEVQIQAAIDALPAGGGVVYLLEGTYTVSTSTATGVAINLATSTKLVGAGKSTIIKLADNINSNASIVYAENVQDVYIGHIAVDGNKAAQNGGWNRGIHLSGTGSSTIENTFVYDIRNEGITLLNSSHSNIIIGNSTDNTDGPGITDTSGSHNIISANTVRDSNDDGIVIWSTTNNRVVDNTVIGSRDSGILVRSSYNSVIVGNSFYDNSIVGTSGSIDIAFSEDNLFSSNSIYATTSIPLIQINDNSYRNILVGNIYENPNSTTYVSDSGTDTRYTEWDRVTLTTDDERAYNLLSVVGSTSAALFSATQYSTGTIMSLFDNATEVFTVADGGNVGIGTTSPFEALSVTGNLYTTGTITGSNLSGTNTGDQDLAPYLTLAAFYSTTTTDIGEGSNLYYTDVRVADYINGSSTIAAPTAATFGDMIYWSGSNWVSAATSTLGLGDGTGPFTSAGGYTTLNTATDFVGLNSSTPWGKLSVQYTDGTDSGPRFVVGSSTASNFIVDATGNVGLGTTSPWAKLSLNYTDGTDTGPRLYVGSSTMPSLFISATGSVAIGTTTDVYNTLTVQGGVCITGGATCPSVAAGSLSLDTAGGGGGNPGVFDVAELYPASEVMEPAEIASIDTQATGTAVIHKAIPGETLIGIISSAPAIAINGSDLTLAPGNATSTSRPLVALAGRVPVKVIGDAIEKGDAIALSDLPGIGRKATSTDTQSVGIALEAWEGSDTDIGSVLVFVHTSYTRLDPHIQGGTITTLDGEGESAYWSVDPTGSIKFIANLDINEFNIHNVKAIYGSAGKWSIDGDGRLVTPEVHTEKLCIGETCVTENELIALLDNANIAAVAPVVTDTTQKDTTDTTQTDPATTTATTTTDTATTTDETTPPADTTPPDVTVTGQVAIQIEEGADYTDEGATAIDDVDGDITVTITATGLPIDTNTPGNYTITYSATDVAGNTGEATRTVSVNAAPEQDTTAPVITLIGAATITLTEGATYTDAGATAADETDGDITAFMDTQGLPIDTNTSGTYSIIYSVSDLSGNTATPVERTVVVEAAPEPPSEDTGTTTPEV